MDNDKELDDLLDSVLDDFDKKEPLVTPKEPSLSEENRQKQKATNNTNNVTIEKTNLYVDDIDYEDRPSATSSKLPSSFLTSKLLSQPASSSNPGPSSSDKKTEEFVNIDTDEMKLFEQIFSDEKTKESMKQFSEVFSMFGQTGAGAGDEQKLLENFQKVMSELNLGEVFGFFDNISTKKISKKTKAIF